MKYCISKSWVDIYPTSPCIYAPATRLSYNIVSIQLCKIIILVKVYMKWKFLLSYLKDRTLKQSYRITDFSDFCSFASFLRYFSLFDIQIIKVSIRHTCIMTYRRRLYSFIIIKRNHFKLCMFGVLGETHTWFLQSDFVR